MLSFIYINKKHNILNIPKNILKMVKKYIFKIFKIFEIFLRYKIKVIKNERIKENEIKNDSDDSLAFYIGLYFL